jgi:DNA-directed RNA polymerase alpha subunit
MIIDEIFQIGNMSVRSYNICKGNKLDTVIELKEYFYEHKSFYKLRNCGRRTNEELIEICNYYKILEVEAKKENPHITKISDLDRLNESARKRMIIDEIYREDEISVRSYHVCKNNNLNSVKELKEYYHKHKTFEKLQNCGGKSNEELIEICNYLSSFTRLLMEVD